MRTLGNDAGASLSGLMGAVDRFQSPLVNAYDPDIILEEALEQNLLLYGQFPSTCSYPFSEGRPGRVKISEVVAADGPRLES